MQDFFSILSDIIKNRRSTKPVKMNGNIIPDEQVEQLLELANWAPTHGNTEPWRFIVYEPDQVKTFCSQHAELYKSYTKAESFLQANYDKILHNGDMVSHIIIAIMQRGNLPKITRLEEEAATSAAIQNILLGATALNIASFWSTGGMVLHPVMKPFLQLREEDVVMGILFLGYADITQTGKRITPLTEKVKWIS
jgi:nitroreductase